MIYSAGKSSDRPVFFMYAPCQLSGVLIMVLQAHKNRGKQT